MNRKLYIFLTTLIRGVGGGHIYTLCKIQYLENNGFDTVYLHANDPTSRIYIDALKKYENNYDRHFFFPTYFYSHKKQIEIVDKVVKRFIPIYDTYDEIFIESQTTTCSTWGELLAEKVHGKHLIYLLDEHPYIGNEAIFEFYKFKLERRELVGIGKESIKNMFKGWRDIEESPYLLAYNKKPLEDVPYDLSKIKKSDYIIGSIGRIEKSFLYPALEVVKEFALNHKDKSISILIIGGAVDTDKPEKAIRKLFKGVVNVSLHITGIIYPMPISLVQLPHIFLSTSGGCLSSVDMGKVTVSFDVKDGKPIGVLNYTTQNELFRGDDEKVPDLYHILCDALIEKKYAETEVLYDQNQELSYKPHFDYIEASVQEKVYYHLVAKGLSKGQWLLMMMVRTLGTVLTRSLVKYIYPLVISKK